MSNIQKQHKISPAIAWLTIQKFIIFYCPLDGEHTTITKRDNDTMKYENLKKIADALNMTPDEIVDYDVSKSLEENLSHGTYYVSKEGSVSPMPTEIGHSNLQTFAAHFDGDEYTDEELEEIKRFAEYIKSRRKTD